MFSWTTELCYGTYMTDAAQTVPPTTNPPPANKADKSPLELLEDILKNNPAAKSSAAAAPATPGQPTELSSADQEMGIARLEEERRLIDEQALAVKQAELAHITETPAYQARVQQNAAVEQANSDQVAAQDGFEIIQLGHKKI
jgi:hypothetical protein